MFTATMKKEALYQAMYILYSTKNFRYSESNKYVFFFFEIPVFLQSVVIHLAKCYGEEVLQCLGERPSVGPLRR
jgi:hypothetical protein